MGRNKKNAGCLKSSRRSISILANRYQSLIHVVVATVAMPVTLFFLGLFRNQGVAGEQKDRDAGRIGQGRFGYFGRVDNARLDQVFVDIGQGVVPKVAFALQIPFHTRCHHLVPALLAIMLKGERQARTTMLYPVISS